MKAVHKDQANNTNACTSTEYDDADVEYLYTASQQRLCKIVKPHKAGGAGISDQSDWEYTWYMYDAGGMVMAVYDQSFRPNGSDWTVNFDLEEHDVYGSGRLGIRHGDDEGKYHQDFSATITSGFFDAFSYSGASAAYAKEHYSRTIGLKQYEVANHLGNVLVTVSDKRLVQDNYHYTLVGLGSDYSYNADLDAYYYTPGTGVYAQTSGADGVLDWYTPDVLSYSDYYAFGAPQTGRNGGDSYRYGFNGMEGDPEMKGQGAHYTTEFRQYDPRVGRWMSPDPVVKPWEGPYTGFANNPIYYKDPAGLSPTGDPSKYHNTKPKYAKKAQKVMAEQKQEASPPPSPIIPPPLQQTEVEDTEVDARPHLTQEVSSAEMARAKENLTREKNWLEQIMGPGWIGVEVEGGTGHSLVTLKENEGLRDAGQFQNDELSDAIANTIAAVGIGVGVIGVGIAAVTIGPELIGGTAIGESVLAGIQALNTVEGLLTAAGGTTGIARIYQYASESPFGHYSIEIIGEESSMHTHQVITSSNLATTTISNVSKSNEMTLLNVKEIAIPNASNAMAYQQSMLGQNLGPYDKMANSCVTHVMNVLDRGGVPMINPDSPLSGLKFLRNNGFNF